MIDKKLGELLRSKGNSYKDIADALQCSVAWCKLNLKDVVQLTPEIESVKELTVKAKSKDAITSGDITVATRKLYPTNNFTKEQKEEDLKNIKRIRDKVKVDDDSVIRPYWLVPDQATESFHALLRLLEERDNRDQEDIDNYRAQFGLDTSYSESIGYALLSMSARGSKILKRSVVTEINRIADIAEVLDARNQPKTFKDSKEGVRIKNPIDLSDIDHLIY